MFLKETSGHFPAMFVATEPLLSLLLSGTILAASVATKAVWHSVSSFVGMKPLDNLNETPEHTTVMFVVIKQDMFDEMLGHIWHLFFFFFFHYWQQDKYFWHNVQPAAKRETTVQQMFQWLEVWNHWMFLRTLWDFFQPYLWQKTLWLY